MAEKRKAYRISDANGTKVQVYFETIADQVIETADRKFFTSAQKAKLDAIIIDSSATYNEATQNNIPTKGSVASYVNSNYATKTYVNTEIAKLVDSAPETLNTLGELATALNEHVDAYDALLATVGNKADASKVATIEQNLNTISGYFTQDKPNKAITDLSVSGKVITYTKGNGTTGTITTQDTTYNAAGSALGLVKTGGDVTISNGVISVGAGKIDDNKLSTTGVTAGTYSAVTVNNKGRVTAGGQFIEWGTSGQTEPSANLVVGGLFFELVS